MKMIKVNIFRTFGILFTASLLIILFAVVTLAAAYPDKPVRLVVTVAAGGSNDTLARQIATKLSDNLGQQVIVDNRPGGGGIIATEIVSKEKPDGYTLLFTSIPHAAQPAIQTLPYDPIKSFTPIARVGTGPFSLVVHPDVPAHTGEEFIALAKQKPGELIIGTSGAGGGSHLVTELFMMTANVKLKVVHFKGGGPAIIDLLGGHSHGFFGSLPQSTAHVKSGKLRMLGICSAKRSSIVPDAPTFAEAGVAGFETSQWWGIFGPAGTPAPVVERLNKGLKVVLDIEEVKKFFLTLGAEVDYLNAADFSSFVVSEVGTWARVVKKANIKIE